MNLVQNNWNEIQALANRIEKRLFDSPRTSNQRQIAGALIVTHSTAKSHAELAAIAVVDFYPTTTNRRTT